MRQCKPNSIFRLSILALAVSVFAVGCLQDEGLVEPGARVVKLGTGYVFTEGPVADGEGNVYFTDIPEQLIYYWAVSDGSVSVFREESGGSNGLFFDASGHIIAAEGETGQITSLSLDGSVEIILDSFEGKKFNRPNDLWIAPNGGIYFTDPAYSREPEDLELDSEDVYYISPDRSSVVRAIGDLVRPNGVMGTADGETLFVADHLGESTWAYDIRIDGSLGGKRLFTAAGADGLTIDERGNVYLTNPENSSVDIYSPEGEMLESIAFPEGPSNVTFAGTDGKMLFVTAVTSVYGISMNVSGQ